MSFLEMLPEIQALSRLDKIRLMQFLSRAIGEGDESLIESGQLYPVWSPDRAFRAAIALLQALDDEKAIMSPSAQPNVTVLDVQAAMPGESALLAEAVLSVDWSRPEEDAAWLHLQPEQ